MLSQGGNELQLTRNGGLMLLESADGKFLYYMRKSSTGPLYRMPVGGGDEQHVLETVAARGYALASAGIYYIFPQGPIAPGGHYEVNRNHTLAFFEFATGRSQALAKLEKPLQLGLTVSSDGRSILYPQIDRLVEDLMLVEGFR